MSQSAIGQNNKILWTSCSLISFYMQQFKRLEGKGLFNFVFIQNWKIKIGLNDLKLKNYTDFAIYFCTYQWCFKRGFPFMDTSLFANILELQNWLSCWKPSVFLCCFPEIIKWMSCLILAIPTTHHVCFKIKDIQIQGQGGVIKVKVQVWQGQGQGQGGKGWYQGTGWASSISRARARSRSGKVKVKVRAGQTRLRPVQGKSFKFNNRAGKVKGWEQVQAKRDVRVDLQGRRVSPRAGGRVNWWYRQGQGQGVPT